MVALGGGGGYDLPTGVIVRGLDQMFRLRDNHHIRRGLESDSVSLTAPLLRSSHLSPPAVLPLQPCSLLCPSSSSFLSFPPVLSSFF